MHNFEKVVNPVMRWTHGGRGYNVFCKITWKDGKLSISGVEGPLSSGNCLGSCGQINMSWGEYNKFNRWGPGWNKAKEKRFLEIWKEYHLNDMQAACEHQRELGWTYKEHYNKDTFKGEDCPVCGYSIGSAWLNKEVPEDVIKWLFNLPNSKTMPAWV